MGGSDSLGIIGNAVSDGSERLVIYHGQHLHLTAALIALSVKVGIGTLGAGELFGL
jgi:hypothetical protein